MYVVRQADDAYIHACMQAGRQAGSQASRQAARRAGSQAVTHHVSSQTTHTDNKHNVVDSRTHDSAQPYVILCGK